MLTTEHYWQSPYIDWVKELPAGWTQLIFHIRQARNKAIVPAVAEALSLLRPFNPVASLSGPLADKKGVFWIGIKPMFIQKCSCLFGRLGYTFAVDQLLPMSVDGEVYPYEDEAEEQNLIRWHGGYFRLQRLCQENSRFVRNRAPDRRTFLLETRTGEIVAVKGYRGDGHDLSRRGLPVEDARMLVNLVTPDTGADVTHRFLDPFAGVGGIIIEAADSDYTVVSLDCDPKLRYGLESLGSFHIVGDATNLPFAASTYSAIATEPPYHKRIRRDLPVAFTEMCRVLKLGGRLSMLVSPWQAELLLREAGWLGMHLFLASPIDRKGTPVAVLGWTKTT